jgi:hypothetical protein
VRWIISDSGFGLVAELTDAPSTQGQGVEALRVGSPEHGGEAVFEFIIDIVAVKVRQVAVA